MENLYVDERLNEHKLPRDINTYKILKNVYFSLKTHAEAHGSSNKMTHTITHDLLNKAYERIVVAMFGEKMNMQQAAECMFLGSECKLTKVLDRAEWVKEKRKAIELKWI